jgi:hypothetical protein
MPPKEKKKKEKGMKQKQKQKQKQQQTVIVNINKQKRSAPRGNGIEKPKENPNGSTLNKEQPKTTNNSFSFSMPQAQQNQLGEYLKYHNKELYRKLDEVLAKSKDPVINSVEDKLKPILAVKSPERIPTPLETPQRTKTLEQTLQENYLKKQEEHTPLNIGEETHLDNVTTLEEPRGLSLDDPILNPPTQPTTIESITTATSPYKDIPIELGAEQPVEPVEIANKELTKETIKSLQATEEGSDLFTTLSRGRGRPVGSKDTVPRIRRTEAELLSSPLSRLSSRFEENPPIFSSVKPIPSRPRATTSDDLTVSERVDKRKKENLFLGIDEPTKTTPVRRASLNFKSPVGTPM